ncbi:uncharacterized protein [Rutidosis leptorrhynchoides]|uniref:uncharacterized protein n=1 Tax=Rutidosis leptorrhynchoides TaxID=125765 RepID=UPI003A99F052
MEVVLEASSFRSISRDTWSWSLASNGLFKVKILSNTIDDHLLADAVSNQGTLRNNLVPKKVELFVWRTLKKKSLPVRLELDKRGVDLNSVSCPLCDDDLESVEHAILFCKHAMEVWDRVFKWCDMGNLSYFTISEIFSNNGSTSMSGLGKKIWLALLWISAYYIWKNRNSLVFKGKRCIALVVFNEIQLISFEWISTRVKGKSMDWHTWLTNPSFYLNSS